MQVTRVLHILVPGSKGPSGPYRGSSPRAPILGPPRPGPRPRPRLGLDPLIVNVGEVGEIIFGGGGFCVGDVDLVNGAYPFPSISCVRDVSPSCN